MKINKLCLMFMTTMFLNACGSPNLDGDGSTIDYNKYEADQIYQKFHDDKIIYNETVCFVEEDEGIFAKLLYSPTEIHSIKDNTLQKEYDLENFYVKDNKLFFKEAKDIPFFSKQNMTYEEEIEGSGIGKMEGKKPGTYVMFTEGPGIVSRQLSITYSHNDIWGGKRNKYQGELLPNTIKKLKDKEHITIGWYGDSIMTGCNSSGKLGVAPYLDDFPSGVTRELSRKFNNENIEMFNSSKGGMLSDWGVKNVDNLVNTYNPDLVFIGFGMNDGSWNIKPETYVEQIETIVNKLQLHNSDVEIVVIATILANPDSTQNLRQEEYLEPLQEMVSNYEKTCLLDMTSYSKYMLSKKRSVDIYANNINHPSDFMVRGYVSNILETLVEDY